MPTRAFLFLSLALVACGSDPGISVPQHDLRENTPADLAGPNVEDFSQVVPVDLSKQPDMSHAPDLKGVDFAAAKLGCHALTICYTDCESSAATQMEYATCAAACDANSKSGATTKYQAALSCGQSWCLNMGSTDANAPAYKCKLGADQSQLVNTDGTSISNTDPGTGQKACGACLNDALAGLFGSTCMNPGPDCDPASCQPTTSACLNDLP